MFVSLSLSLSLSLFWSSCFESPSLGRSSDCLHFPRDGGRDTLPTHHTLVSSALRALSLRLFVFDHIGAGSSVLYLSILYHVSLLWQAGWAVYMYLFRWGDKSP